MKARSASRLAWIAFAIITLCLVSSLVALVLITSRLDALTWGKSLSDGLFLVAMFSFPVVGVLIATRKPGNAIGYLLLGIGLVWQLSGVAGTYSMWAYRVDPGSLPRPDLVVALSSGIWVPAIGLMGTFLLLLFPDGHPPSRRWRPLAWFSGLLIFGMWLLFVLAPAPLDELMGEGYVPSTPNPLGVDALEFFFAGPLFVLLLLLPLCMLACAVSLVVRFRRSRGEERLQLKWLTTGAAVTAVVYLIGMLGTVLTGAYQGSSEPQWLLVLDMASVYAWLLIPGAVGVAILRHRLYDIDVIINRELVYGALTAILALVYVIGVVGIGGALREISGQQSNSVAVAASTLAVAALVRPARTHVQSFIDRRFYRSRYDAVRTVEEFSHRQRDEVTLETVTSDLLRVVGKTVQPTHASLWLRSRPS